MQWKTLAVFAASVLLSAQTDNPSSDLTERVTRMARIGSVTAPSFSPDGRWLSVLSNLNGTPQVYVIPSSGGWPRMITDGTDPVVGAVWAPRGDTLAITIAPGGGLNTQVYVIGADGTGLRRLTDGKQDNNAFDAWSEDGRKTFINSNRRDPASRDSFAIDVTSGRIELVAKNPGVGFITNVTRDGRYALLGRVRSRGNNNLYLLDLTTEQDTLLTPHEGVAQYFGEITVDGRAVYMASNESRDLAAFARVKLNGGTAPGKIEVIRERTDAELDGLRLNDQGTVAALMWNVAGRSELELIDLQTMRALPSPKLPGEIAGLPSFSRDGRQMAATISGAAQPPDVWVADVGQPFRKVTSAQHVGVDLSTLVRPELVRFKAHDGLELSAWLYRPKFVNLDNGELRFNGIKDIKSCVDYLVSNRLADPKRIGITGGSYGGYMTMVGVTEYPELFAAGVNLFGMVNFFTFFQQTQPWMAAISTIEYGDPATQNDLLEKLSPLGKLDRIRAALMVQHGANDTNVPVIEAEQIVKHLKSRGVPVEYVLFPDEGHGWRKIPNRIRSTVAMVRFFDKHLNGGRGPDRNSDRLGGSHVKGSSSAKLLSVAGTRSRRIVSVKNTSTSKSLKPATVRLAGLKET